MNLRRTSFVLVAWSMFAVAVRAADGNWPQWRGPRGDGHAVGPAPTSWTPADVAWTCDLPGRGQSSPVIWGERIFLTASSEDGRERIVVCVDRRTGKLLWQKAVSKIETPEELHKMNTFASSTCVTDGERVVAFFGRGGIHCLDVDGNLVWSRELGNFAGPWGTGASPILVGDVVIQNCDAEDDAFLIGLDKRTGGELWRTPREKLRGWSTPIRYEVAGTIEVAVNGERGIDAYDPTTGEHLWHSQGDKGRGTPTVVPYRDLLIAVSGRPGDMWATRIGGRGEVNATHEVWRTKRTGTRDLPSPIVVGDRLVVFSLNPGIVSLYDAATGELAERLRVEGNFAASPIAVDGLIYCVNEDGETYVLRPGEKLEVVARNRLEPTDEEVFRASLVVLDGQVFCRSTHRLYCIGKRTASP